MELGKTKLDTSLAREGVWTEFVVKTGPRESTVIKLKLALAQTDMNPAYKAALRKALEPHERMLALYSKASDIPESLVKAVNDAGRKVFLENVVVDWDGPTRDGKPVPYSPEAAAELFQEYPELQAQAEAEAGKYERYRVRVLENAAGN